MTIPITFNDQYLNQTVNKDLRAPNEPYLARCWHETANGSGDAHSTLKWNLKATQTVKGKTYDVYSSYDILVARDGTAYRYVDWTTYNSWSEGVSSAVIDGKTYRDNLLGRRMLGIELDGPNNGTPATPAQIDTAARIVLLTSETLHIPGDGKHDFTHAQIAPNRKTDPKGYTVRQILVRAAEIAMAANKPVEPDWPKLWGTAIPYINPTFGIPTAWRDSYRLGKPLGEAVTGELAITDYTVQCFKDGYILYSPAHGCEVRPWRD